MLISYDYDVTNPVSLEKREYGDVIKMFKTLLVQQMSIISPMDNVYNNVTSLRLNQETQQPTQLTLDERLLIPCELDLTCINVDLDIKTSSLTQDQINECKAKLNPFTRNHIDNSSQPMTLETSNRCWW